MSQKRATPSIDSLLSSCLPFAQILRGSLVQRRTFHSSGCSKCAEGTGHPQWVVTVTYPGSKTKQVSVTAGQLPQIRQWIANYRRIKDALEAISEINLESLRSARDAAKARSSSGLARQRGKS
jgi:hypothetical protein